MWQILPRLNISKNNGLGDRYQQTFNSQTTTYTPAKRTRRGVDIATPLTQVITDGTNAYLYGAARIAQSSAGGSQYFLTDALGSVNQLYDPAVSTNDGIVLEQTWIDAYGVPNAPSGTASTPYGFTGEFADPTGLTFLRARYYSSATARFISQDPFGGFKQAPQSLNPYIYSKNNPVVYTDPSGEFPPLWLLLMLGIAGMLQGCSPDEQLYPPTNTPTLPPPRVRRMTHTPSPTQTPSITPSPTESINWLAEPFLITHYHIVLEDDPFFANSWDVWVKGEPMERGNKHLYHFVYSDQGVVIQGTGKTKEGEYITIDQIKSDMNPSVPVEEYFFTYQKGGAHGEPIAWQTVASGDPNLIGRKVKISIYGDRVFTVLDSGTQLKKTGQLDVFIGETFVQEALNYGRIPDVKVGIIE